MCASMYMHCVYVGMCANCTCMCMCVYAYVYFTVASPGPGIFRSSVNILELNESLLNKQTNTGKKRGWAEYRKIETVSGWGEKHWYGKPLSHEREETKEGAQCRRPTKLSPTDQSITFSASWMIIFSPCIWDFASWVFQTVSWASLTSQTQEIPFDLISS